MANFKATFKDEGGRMKASFRDEGGDFKASFGNAQIIETGDYNKLLNRPSYNGVVWDGNKTFNDMGDYNITNKDILKIFNRVFKNS